jgi:hypothetical protein
MQEAVRRLHPPVVVGSAGSNTSSGAGSRGRVLYVSALKLPGPVRACTTRTVADAAQEAELRTTRLNRLRVPPGAGLVTAFAGWLSATPAAARCCWVSWTRTRCLRFAAASSARAQTAPLDLPKLSGAGAAPVLDSTARTAAHALFQRYRRWLAESSFFDRNLIAHSGARWRSRCMTVVIDEVRTDHRCDWAGAGLPETRRFCCAATRTESCTNLLLLGRRAAVLTGLAGAGRN